VDAAAADHRRHLVAHRVLAVEQPLRRADRGERVVEPAEPLEDLAAHAQRLAAQAIVVDRGRQALGGERGGVGAGVVAEPEHALRAPDRDVGEPRRLTRAQRLERVEVVGVGREVALQAVGLLASASRRRACEVGVGGAAPSSRSRSSVRVKQAIAALVSEADSASRPARSQNAAAPAGSPPRSRWSAIADGGSSRPAKNRDASRRPTRAWVSRCARGDSDS
jgi:hypothetical protein